jgi:hypothetical protein
MKKPIWIRTSIVLVVISGIIATCVWMFSSAEYPAGPFEITVSKETTYVTEHLHPDGTVDYASYMNERLAKGVTPENNLMVDLVRTMYAGKDPYHYFDRFNELLGIEPIDREQSYFAFYAEGYIDPEDFSAEFDANEDLEIVLSKPSNIENHKFARLWLRDNNRIVDELVKRIFSSTKLYTPAVSLPIDDNADGVPTFEFIDLRIHYCRSLAKFLRARSMHKLNVGDIEGAQTDLLACRKLANLLFESGRYFNFGAAASSMQAAVEGEMQMGFSSQCTAEHLAAYREKLKSCSPKRNLQGVLEMEARLYSLAEVIKTSSGSKNIFAASYMPEKIVDQLHENTDWDLVLKHVNHQVDLWIQELENDPFKSDELSLPVLRHMLYAEKYHEPSFLNRAKFFWGNAQTKADMIAPEFIKRYHNRMESLCNQVANCKMREEIGAVVLALFHYQREQGRFPEKLKQLTPHYLAPIPIDRFSGKPLIYKRQGEHFVLYSVGSDKEDNCALLNDRFGFIDADIGFHSDPGVWIKRSERNYNYSAEAFNNE